MKILFVSETYYPHLNGVYYFVARLGPLLQQKGHQVAVVALSEKNEVVKKKDRWPGCLWYAFIAIIILPKNAFSGAFDAAIPYQAVDKRF